MKRIFAIVLCAILMVGAFAIGVSAEETEAVVDETPIVETTPVEEPTITETIVDYVKNHVEEISVIVTLIVTVYLNSLKHRSLNSSIGTLNNNSVSIAQNALSEVASVSSIVGEYTAKIETLLAEFRANAEDKEKLAGMLAKAETFIETAKLANVELANEVAELLVLANIPNAKKDELYSRHLNAVNAIADAEHTEVIHHDGEEA